MKLRIKEILKEKGVSIKDLAEKLSITSATLSKSINGNPTVETLNKIADALDVSIVELFEPEEDITGIIVINGVTHQINSFKQLSKLCESL